MEEEDSSRSDAKPLEAEIDQDQVSPPEPPERVVRRTTAELTVQTFEFSGPLPPPQILQGYNKRLRAAPNVLLRWRRGSPRTDRESKKVSSIQIVRRKPEANILPSSLLRWSSQGVSIYLRKVKALRDFRRSFLP